MADIHIIRSTDTPASKPSTMYEEELTNKFGKKEEQEKKPLAEAVVKEEEKEIAQVQAELEQASVTELPYEFPPLSLLSSPKGNESGINNDELRATAAKLQETLESFGVRIRMGDISLGPSVTRYELIPEQGVKVSKITGLSDDIKLSLAASDIRIEAPIPERLPLALKCRIQNARRLHCVS